MYVDVAALVLILIYGIMGYRYGLTGAILNLAGMVGGYIAALMYAKQGAVMLSQRTGIAPLLALPLASLLIFVIVTRAFYLVHLLVRKVLEGDKRGPSPLLTLDKLGGLGYGLVKGTAIVAVVIWGLPTLLGSSAISGQIGLADSTVAAGVRGTIETAGRYAFGMVTEDPNAQAVMAHAVAEPRAVVQEATNLVANPRLKACLSDPFVQQQAKSSGLLGVVNSGQFEQVLADDSFQKSLKSIGFQPINGRTVSREEIGRAVENVTTKFQSKVAQLKASASTQEMQALLSDPTVQEQLKKGEITQLLNDPRVARALGLSEGATPQGAPPAEPRPSGGPLGNTDAFGGFGAQSRGGQAESTPQVPAQASRF